MSGEESFPARLQRYNRIQVHTLIRWRHKLEPGEVLYVRVYNPESYHDEEFYAKLLKGGRIPFQNRLNCLKSSLETLCT